MIREARPSLWTPPLPGTSATLAVAVARGDWASGVLTSLTEGGERVLRDGTAFFYGSFSLLTEVSKVAQLVIAAARLQA
jgi:hypothetical protein